MTGFGDKWAGARIVVLVFAGIPAGAWLLLARPDVRPLIRVAGTLAIGLLLVAAGIYIDGFPRLVVIAVLFGLIAVGSLALAAFAKARPSVAEIKAELARLLTRRGLAEGDQAGERGGGDEGDKPGETSPGRAVGPPDEGGVEALLEIATATVDDERARGRSLDTKAASVTAFVGVVLSLNATLGRPLLNAKLGSAGDLLVRIFFITSVVALLLGALAAIVAVFRPQGYRGLKRQQLQQFAEPHTQAMTKLAVHQAMLGALADILTTDRPVNDSKATALKFAAFFIAVGLTGVAGEALTLGLSKIGV